MNVELSLRMVFSTKGRNFVLTVPVQSTGATAGMISTLMRTIIETEIFNNAGGLDYPTGIVGAEFISRQVTSVAVA